MADVSDTTVPFKDYVDGQLVEVRRAAAVAATMPKEGVDLREYIEALFDEHRKAIEMAEREREKAAAALRVGLERSIEEGDKNLLSHIATQVEQIRAALASSESLEIERIALVTSRVDNIAAEIGKVYQTARDTFELRITGVQRELAIANNAAATAIAKAEAATEKRFESVNEFRAQLADQVARFVPREVADGQFQVLHGELTALTERLGKLEGTTGHYVTEAAVTTRLSSIDARIEQNRGDALPRETFETVVGSWTTWRESIDRVISTRAGERAALAANEAKVQPWQLWGAGAVVTLLVACIVIVTNVLTG